MAADGPRRRVSSRASRCHRATRGAWRLVGLIPLLAIAAGSAFAQEVLTLTLASQPVQSGVISTTRSDERSFQVLAGSTLRFSTSQGRDSRLVAGGLFWTQVQELPRDAQRLELTPALREDGRIDVHVVMLRKDGDAMQTLDTRIVVSPGEWAQLYGPALASTPGQRVYGSAGAVDSLYLRAVPAP